MTQQQPMTVPIRTNAKIVNWSSGWSEVDDVVVGFSVMKTRHEKVEREHSQLSPQTE